MITKEAMLPGMTGERLGAERILGAVAHAMRGGCGACLFGVAREDGSVAPWMDGAFSWASVEDFMSSAARQGRASALLERRMGEGCFGTGVVLPSGAVVEAGGRHRRWRSTRAFLKAAGAMGSFLVRWHPVRRVRRSASPDDARQ